MSDILAENEIELEGSYWLALLSGSAFALEEDTVHSGQLYRKGWIVAMGRWYKLRQQSERGYELLPAEVRPCHLVTLSSCHLVTLSPCNLVTWDGRHVCI